MAQYCRYCAWAYNADDDKIWCRKRDAIFTEKQVKHSNTCKLFALNEIDVLREKEKGYRPTGIRIAPVRDGWKQIGMDEFAQGDRE